MTGAGLGRHTAARPTQELGPEDRIGAKEPRGRGIVDAQARQQGLGGVAGAGGLAAKEGESVRVERVDLLLQGQWLDGLRHFRDGQSRSVRTERGHGQRAAAATEQQGRQQRGDMARVMFQRVGGLGQPSAAGGDQTVLQ